MATKTRKKTLPVCVKCGSNDALYINFKNGERLPSYVMRIGQGIFCNPCAEASK